MTYDRAPGRNSNANKLKSAVSSRQAAALAIGRAALLHSIAGDSETSNDILCFTDPVR